MRVKNTRKRVGVNTKGFWVSQRSAASVLIPRKKKKKKSFERNTLGFNPQAEPTVAEMCDHHCTAIKGRLRVAHLKRRSFTIHRVKQSVFATHAKSTEALKEMYKIITYTDVNVWKQSLIGLVLKDRRDANPLTGI